MLRPSLPPFDDVLDHLKRVFSGGQITNGQYVREFENKTAEYLDVKHCVAVSSCTLGLMLVERALELTGEVILPSFTFSATGHSLIWNGLKPVFVDCLKDSFNLDPFKIEEKITERTSAIVAVHVFGNPTDADLLTMVAEKHNLRLIFDAAHAFGAHYRGDLVGRGGDAEVFSLSPTKLLITGEGGLVATNNGELARKIRIGRNYGDPGNYDCEFAGLNARMPEWNAVVGIKSLGFLEENIQRRNYIARLYRQGLRGIPGVKFQTVDFHNRSTCKDFTIFVDTEKFGLNRDMLAIALDQEGIQTRKYFYPPLHKMKAYQRVDEACVLNLPVTDYLSKNVISLPIYSLLSDDDAEKICHAITCIQTHGHEIHRVLAEKNREMP